MTAVTAVPVGTVARTARSLGGALAPTRAAPPDLVRAALALHPSRPAPFGPRGPRRPDVETRPSGLWRAPVIVIDGRSGSGKSVLSARLAEALRTAGGGVWRGVQVAHLDSWYPGWHGLEAGTALTEDLLTRVPAFPEWDWARGRIRRWVRLDPGRPLLVEGSGALTRRVRAASDLRVWVDVAGPGDIDEGAPAAPAGAGRDLAGRGTPAAAVERRSRALERDGDTYRPWWDAWAAQEIRHIERHRPRALADLEVLV